MALKYKGSIDDLKKIVESCGYKGAWTEDAEKFCFRAEDGAIMNWWPKNGTINFQGSPEAKNKFESILASMIGAPILAPAHVVGAPKENGTIFIVHGHDTDSRDQLELALRRMGLEPLILMNTTGGGKTIIEALEGHIGKNHQSDFGIVLITPDDIGGQRDGFPQNAEPRARQNVILELGMLFSSLTRSRMALLVKGHVELPSDIQGVIQLRYNDHIRDIVPRLAERLKECGIEVTAEGIAAATA